MNKPQKSITAQLKETATDLVPHAVQLLSPEIITNPEMIIVRVAQSVASFYAAKLRDEVKQRKDDGSLRENYHHTEKPALILRELMEKIDGGKIDEEHFHAIKSLFFAASSVNASMEQEIEAYQFMETCNKLSSTELLILAANYRIALSKNKPVTPGINLDATQIKYWAEVLATELGNEYPEMILQYQGHMIDLGLLTGVDYQMNTNEVRNNFVKTPYFRLTKWGFKLCQLIPEK